MNAQISAFVSAIALCRTAFERLCVLDTIDDMVKYNMFQVGLGSSLKKVHTDQHAQSFEGVIHGNEEGRARHGLQTLRKRC